MASKNERLEEYLNVIRNHFPMCTIIWNREEVIVSCNSDIDRLQLIRLIGWMETLGFQINATFFQNLKQIVVIEFIR